MHLVIRELIPRSLADALVGALGGAPFVDGGSSAGPANRALKNNRELLDTSYMPADRMAELYRHVRTDRRLGCWTMPRASAPLLFNRFEAGMYYRDHVDNAIAVLDRQFHRCDLSMTIFLSRPETYVGGALVIENDPQQTFKLDAGDAVVYPSGMLHRVDEVTSGVRLAAVTWIESLIRDHEERQIVYDLAMSRDAIGADAPFELRSLLAKCVVNLERLFVD